ncbi:hypothetical protein QBC46DRAFT_122918 [Diplogelasinospora grovesii]|uniref:MFS maltose permease n=1 Tax=Diplogelasinospora grovesii TaxID=303347 RepID=A0AAN6S493_9PEZI|nr:hypothetical protein QBC46DRAFT_122918 [Diplogelasinospora grovesii]
MLPRLIILRRVLARALQSRSFARSSGRQIGTRPQLPFLSIPTPPRPQQQFRYLTTERKARLKYEVKLGLKYVAYIYAAVAALSAGAFAISQELLERQHPTPHEWSFLTRMRYRGAHCERDQTDPNRITDWLAIMQWIKGAVERLEDPNVDGSGLKKAPSDRPRGTKDISAMPESWRRGYYESMMMYAKAAENVDGWVLDKSRNIIFPPEMMHGPSNPRPKPIPPGYKGAPKEEDCEVAFESPDNIYLRILSTEGLTTRQRMDAGLAYASWLEFKGLAGPANIMYEDAVELAASERHHLQADVLDRKSWTLDEKAGPPSANLLTSLTAYATFRARHGDVSSALPMLVSILKARRSLSNLPSDEGSSQVSQLAAPVKGSVGDMAKFVINIFAPPAYPPPPGDGTAPPTRDAKELCEEAALHLHIGEIMYASQAASREEGLAWTREAVDIAEEQLHKLDPHPSSTAERAARTTCRECLAAGLDNWSHMVARLAREEAAKKIEKESQPTKSATWFSFWGEGSKGDEDPSAVSRWAAEEKVIQERQRRSQELLDELEPPANGLMSIFHA